MKMSSISAILILGLALFTHAQTTAFTYQGSLTDGGNPANGSFQMRFRLFDALSDGTQIGSTIPDVPVTVTNGLFKAQLDFTAAPFGGANRWLEIAVRRNSGESYVTLGPRQQLTSSPYSVRTLSAALADDSQKLGGVNANEYVTATSGGTSFIRNQTTLQASSNFNISGAGTVGSLNSGGALSITGIAPPATAPAGQGRIFFDSATNKFRISENGAAYVNLVGAGGVSGSGTANRLSFWSAGTTLGDSVISQLGSNIGIGTTAPGSGLELRGTGLGTQQRITDNVSGNSLVLQGGPGISTKVTGWNYNTATAQPLYLSTDGGNTFLNANGGSVGIGMTSPTHTLDVNGFFRASHVAGGNVVSETTGGVNGWAKLWMRTPVQSWSIGSSHTFNGNQLYFSNESAGLIRMAIMPNGNVGIGTTNPSGGLEIYRNWDSQFGALTLRGVQPTIRFSGDTSGNQSWLIHQPAAGHGNLEFYSSTTPGNWGAPKVSFGTNGITQIRVLQILGGSDLAENFEMADREIKPGMVVAIDADNAGKLILASGAYNRRVAGIVSGANDLPAGMILPDLKIGENSQPIALSGRVWVYADATANAIVPGDLLTTSEMPGHAMKVTKFKKANGAIIGKAMTGLRSGTGLVLVLVSLQ